MPGEIHQVFENGAKLSHAARSTVRRGRRDQENSVQETAQQLPIIRPGSTVESKFQR